jgi:hypothetical protein
VLPIQILLLVSATPWPQASFRAARQTRALNSAHNLVTPWRIRGCERDWFIGDSPTSSNDAGRACLKAVLVCDVPGPQRADRAVF